MIIKSFCSVMRSYSELLFLNNRYFGLAFMLITFLNPTHGLSGLVAVASAYAFARFIGYHNEFLSSGFFTYNALLVGLSISHIFSLSPLSIMFIMLASMITLLVTISLSEVLYIFFGLPVLSTPFVIVSSLIYLTAAKFSNLSISEYHSVLGSGPLAELIPFWITGLLKSMGAILFLPNALVGLLILTLIFTQSRVLFFLAVLGYYAGTLIQGTFIGSYQDAFNELNAFNYPLIAMAIGGVFNIPTIKSTVFALIAVGMATILIKAIDTFWADHGIPVLTLPFVVVTFAFNYVLRIAQDRFRTTEFKTTPEETAEYYYSKKIRYTENTGMYLPFFDSWSVYQGFDGEWTHKGFWKYAYDFVKVGSNGLTYANEGRYLEDYYCYKQPVCAPCSGVVVFTFAELEDNPIGVVDTINNWGNYVVIRDDRGYYVGLCHLAKNSVTVRPGDYVEAYQLVALCGNSGYSPQPHIHMQFQVTSYLSSATIPFSFLAVRSGEKIYHHRLPQIGEKVAPLFVHKFYLQSTNFILDQLLRFKILKNESFVENVEFKVAMNAFGTFYLARNESKLYFGIIGSSFYFYNLEGDDKYLRMLFLALPSLPLSYAADGHWEDVVPTSFYPSTKLQLFQGIKRTLSFKVGKNSRYHFEADTIIAGSIDTGFGKVTMKTKIVLDPYYKISYVEVQDYKYILLE